MVKDLNIYNNSISICSSEKGCIYIPCSCVIDTLIFTPSTNGSYQDFFESNCKSFIISK